MRLLGIVLSFIGGGMVGGAAAQTGSISLALCAIVGMVLAQIGVMVSIHGCDK
jgi:hypothetical protein